MSKYVQVLDFDEVEWFWDAFTEAQKQRRVRQPAHVLVVEDDPLTRRMVVNVLSETNAMITESSARGAVASYLMHAPEIVFLDIGLPDIDGFAVLSQIMEIDPEAFIVMFSSQADAKNIDRAMTAGAKGFVAKPFKKETLCNYIEGSAAYHHKVG